MGPMEFKIAISKLKIIKRECKLPNLSHFTYTSIVQPILQANNPIYTVFEPILHSFWTCFTLKVAPSKQSINGKNGRFNYYLRNVFTRVNALNFHQRDWYFLPEAPRGFVSNVDKAFGWIPFGACDGWSLITLLSDDVIEFNQFFVTNTETAL